MHATEPLDDTVEQRDLRTAVRRLLAARLPQSEAQRCDVDGDFSRPTWRALGTAGFLGIGAPEEVGGSGGTVQDALVVVEEVAAVLPSLAVDLVLTGMAMRLLPGVVGVPKTWVPDIAKGALIVSFALSEPDVGTDLLGLRTTARQDGADLLVQGQKSWITLAGEADHLVVLARTEPIRDGRRARGLTLLAVPTDAAGLSVRRIPMSGMRATGSYEVFLDDVRVPVSRIVGERGEALPVLSRTLDVERILAAGISLGIGRAALDLTVEHLQCREAFGGPIGRFQALQHPAADSLAELNAARALVGSAARAVVEGRESRQVAAMAKLLAAETAARIVDRGMRALGAMGLAQESAMQMYFRDARLQLFSPVSNEMVRNQLGEYLGLARSY